MTTRSKLIISLSSVFLLSASITGSIVLFVNLNKIDHGLETKNSITNQILPANTTTASASLQPTVILQPENTQHQIKGEITIALLGDSMIDTLYPFEYLNNYFVQIYPNVKFKLLNYGLGATNVVSGLSRLNNPYQHNDQQILPLLSQKADLVILESFAYNHSSNDQTGFDNQNNTYAQIISQLTNAGSRVVMLATISPNSNLFAQGAPGINFTIDQRANEVLTINNYLKNTISFAKNNKLTLIDAYTPSQTSQKDGNLKYINSSDHIHPSPEGIEFVSDIIANTISKNNIIEEIINSKN